MIQCPRCNSPLRIGPPQSSAYKYECGNMLELDVAGYIVDDYRTNMCFKNQIKTLEDNIRKLEISIESLIYG